MIQAVIPPIHSVINNSLGLRSFRRPATVELTPNDLVRLLLIFASSQIGNNSFDWKEHSNAFLVCGIGHWILPLGYGLGVHCRGEEKGGQGQGWQQQKSCLLEEGKQRQVSQVRIGEGLERWE